MMSDLEEYVASLKGSLFLSASEEIFLKTLKEKMKVPEEVIKEGIRSCYRKIKRNRSKHPVFLCYGEIMKVYERYLRTSGGFNWRTAFRRKLKKIGEFMDTGSVREPSSEEEAIEILKDLERRFFRRLWKRLEKEEKEKLMKKFREYRRDRELFLELIKAELMERYKIPSFSLYSD